MTNKEILIKAIEKALDRSWDMYDHDKWSWEIINNPGKTERDHYFVRAWVGDLQHFIDVYYILFNHEFAKSLWGEELNLGQNEYHRNNIKSYPMYEWQWKLTQMVIAEDPIEYLGENI